MRLPYIETVLTFFWWLGLAVLAIINVSATVIGIWLGLGAVLAIGMITLGFYLTSALRNQRIREGRRW